MQDGSRKAEHAPSVMGRCRAAKDDEQTGGRHRGLPALQVDSRGVARLARARTEDHPMCLCEWCALSVHSGAQRPEHSPGVLD